MIKPIPSIDILDGKVVRLFQGNYERVTEYSSDPMAVMETFSGFSTVHVVNLDGAKGVYNEKTESILAEISKTFPNLQIGGGIRTVEKALEYVKIGANVVLGTVCVKNKDLAEKIIMEVGQHNVVLAFDCLQNNHGDFIVKTHGWKQDDGMKLDDMLDYYSKYDVTVLCTDISVDGTLVSPNFELYRWIKQSYSMYKLQASGGVSCMEDILKLNDDKIDGVIIGRALHSGLVSVRELKKLC